MINIQITDAQLITRINGLGEDILATSEDENLG
jgi:hypothetical protein